MRDDDALQIPGLRRIPHSPEAEAALLGAILVNNRAFDRVSEFLRAEHFAVVDYGTIYAAAAALIEAGGIADPITLRRDVRIADMDLMALAECAVSVVDAAHYGRLIHELARRRQIIAIGESIVARAYDAEIEDLSAAQIEAAISAMDGLAADRSCACEPDPVAPSEWAGVTVPERAWLVHDWIPAGRVVGLMGQGGVGKSLVAQQLQAACALGAPWLGLQTAQCRSLGVYCEDEPGELQRRQIDIANAYSVPLADLDAMLLWSRVGYDSRMAIVTRDGELTMQPFFSAVRHAARKHKARLIILDNAGDLFTLNQNDDVHARLAINAVCARLARELDATVLLLRHPSRAGMMSGDGDAGSVAWTNAFRARLYLDYEPATADGERDKFARVLSHRKSNYGAQADDLKLRWQAGVLAPEGGGGFVDGIEQRSREREAEDAFLACLREVTSRGGYVGDTVNSGQRYAPKAFKSLDAGRGYRITDLEAAMRRLFNAKRIVLGEVRKPDRKAVTGIVEVARS